MDEANPPLFERFLRAPVGIALRDTPVVMINGPRQCGKTTLVRDFVSHTRRYTTLDDETVLNGARADPIGFVRNLDGAIIDEVQRAPELLRAIKKAVDEDRRPGRFLLTGSANVLTLPQVADSLAGRMEVVTLLPLAQAEILGQSPSFIQNAFAGSVSDRVNAVTGPRLVQTVLAGGYPEMLQRTDPKRQQAWARAYIRAIVQRDVQDIAEVEKLDQLPRLLQILTHHSGQLINMNQVGGQIGLDDKTVRKYLGIFEQLFLIRRLEPWFRNPLNRLVKTPKLHFLDSGLLAAMTGATETRIAANRSLFGPLLENFVLSEIIKLCSWLDEPCTLSHFRDKDQNEVDIIVENPTGALLGIEVKSAATVNTADFKGLHRLANAAGEDFKLGIVLYDGARTVPFGERLVAAPIASLWAS